MSLVQDLIGRCGQLYAKAKAGPTRLPTRVVIPRSNVDDPDKLGPRLEQHRNYFQVRVNELYLANGRQWFAGYDPMVFVVSEFIYDEDEIAVPFVVGPSLLEGRRQDLPTGMVFTNTRVAGIHPYRGGPLTLTLILYRLQRVNTVRDFLTLVEKTAGALDFSTAVATYTALAGTILDGVEYVLGLGNTVPVIGHRFTIDPQAGDDCAPRFFALIDAPEDQFARDQLRVREGQLYEGDKLFRRADYVLYSLVSADERSDESTLPFYPAWKRVAREAAVPTKAGWESAKSNMLSLYQSVTLSPDVTEPHAEQLLDRYVKRMQRIHDDVVGLANRGAAERDIELSRFGVAGLEQERPVPAMDRDRSLRVLQM